VERAADFEVDRELLLYLVERFTAKLPDFKFAPHPMFPGDERTRMDALGYCTPTYLRQFGA